MTTQKPIDSLTPEELRVECAEAMGWEELSGPKADASALIPGLRIHYFRNTRLGITKWRAHPYPKYPADANAALQLAHALAKDGWTRSGWRTEDGPENAVFGRGDKGHAATATGPHAFALALCRAYMSVIRAGKEQQDWWCCKADYGSHEPTCANYKP